MSLESFVKAYIECALWSSTNPDDPDNEPFDSVYGSDDLAPETVASMNEDCKSFYTHNEAIWSEAGMDDANAGHDFWLTRNRHGAGFWDRGIGKAGNVLTNESRVYGSCNLYVGDNGLIYLY